MSDLTKMHWYIDGKRLVRRMDRWVSRKDPKVQVGQESDWLGWDGWVRTDGIPQPSRSGHNL